MLPKMLIVLSVMPIVGIHAVHAMPAPGWTAVAKMGAKILGTGVATGGRTVVIDRALPSSLDHSQHSPKVHEIKDMLTQM